MSNLSTRKKLKNAQSERMNCIPKVDERPLPEARSGSVVEKNDQFGTSADILFDYIIFLSIHLQAVPDKSHIFLLST